MRRFFLRCDWLAVWILWSAWCQITGWLLSSFGHLDRAGYAVTTLFFVAGIVAAHRHCPKETPRPAWIFRRSTYARALPKLWLGLTLLVFIGGLLYHPDNYDYLTYRFTRVIHWAWEHRWHWIDTVDDRMNTSAVGMEWLMTPLFVLFRTDRLFFLINFTSFLLLPGLVFSTFCRLGISGRVAWWWMWILPTGYCFLLQAASMGNDAFAALYFLAALHYAYRADARSPLALVLSIIAIALLTGSKLSNIPLLLPWLVVMWFQRGPLLAAIRPVLLLVACVAAGFCSFVPVSVANIHFAGTYTGDPANKRHLQAGSPAIGFIGNAAEIVTGNLSPPVWPREIHWPFQQALTRRLHADFPRFDLNTVPFQIEENCGVGLGVSALAALGVVYGWRRRSVPWRPEPDWPALAIVASIIVAWLGYMLKMSSEAAPRLVAVYYIAGIAALLLFFPVAGPLVHRRWWRGVGYATMATAFVLIVLNPSRPLLPGNGIAAGLRLVHAPARAVAQLEDNYRERAQRRDIFYQLRESLPPSEPVVGFLRGGDDPEVSLWLPFGSRHVVEVYPTTADPAARHLRYVIVSGGALQNIYHRQLDELLKKWSMIVVTKQNMFFKNRRQGEIYYLLRSSG
jgi:hypothetical protein